MRAHIHYHPRARQRESNESVLHLLKAVPGCQTINCYTGENFELKNNLKKKNLCLQNHEQQTMRKEGEAAGEKRVWRNPPPHPAELEAKVQSCLLVMDDPWAIKRSEPEKNKDLIPIAISNGRASDIDWQGE